MRPVGRLHVITDTNVQSRYSHLDLAQLALAGGADCIQYRRKSGTTRELIEEARSLVGICRRANVPLVVNDRIDVAIAADAMGVHLGQHDFPLTLAREWMGPDRIIGGSASTLEMALEVQKAGADYVGFGALYTTGSKPDASAPQGPAALGEVARALEIPVIAIGGITGGFIEEVMAAGAHGVAVIAAVVSAEDPEAAAAALRASINAAQAGPGRGPSR